MGVVDEHKLRTNGPGDSCGLPASAAVCAAAPDADFEGVGVMKTSPDRAEPQPDRMSLPTMEDERRAQRAIVAAPPS